MSKVTSKLQVTIPKAIADAYGIEPGAELVFEAAGDVLRVRPQAHRRAASPAADLRARLAAFDEGTKRQQARDRKLRNEHPDMFAATARGWRREDLYDRGLPR
jgi:AbrB family looped-hinge helix DNA binding protein